MKRSVLLSLTGITSLTLLFLSAAHATPELRDMPHKGGANAQLNTEVRATWNATHTPGGVYFARLTTPQGV